MNFDFALVLALLFTTVRLTTPLLITALGGLFAERSGVTNIGLEGMILFGAATAAIVAQRLEAPMLLDNPNAVVSWAPWLGLLAGVAAGALVGGLHAVASIRFKADQIVSGTAINLLAAGFPSLILQFFYNNTTNSLEVVNKLPDVIVLSERLSPVVFLAFLLVPLVWWVLYRTPWGLRLRAVGEHPEAAETMGVNVIQMRYSAVILSGALAGLAGAYLSIGFLNQFIRDMSAGQGFVALAALIFGKWHPMGVLGSTLLFGFFSALSIQLQGSQLFSVPIVQALPYLLTILVLAGFIGRSRAPAAIGKPYDK
jgi:ABC-type uncharacterized transport system permease subunit